MKTIGSIIFLFLFQIYGYSQNKPKIEFKYLNWDFGKVEFKNDTLVAVFPFTNKSKDTLDLFVKGFTNFLTFDYNGQIIGLQSGSIIVKYYNPNPGAINKSIVIQTNDPENQSVILRIKGETYKK